MQVFVPCKTFEECAASLDKRRLVKQALECTQLLDAMLGLPTKSGRERKGWKNHPAFVMWEKSPGALINYLSTVAHEMNIRGCKSDTYEDKVDFYDGFRLHEEMPWWWGDDRIHTSHRYRLLQKAYEDFEKNQKIGLKSVEWYGSLDWPEKSHSIFEHEYMWVIDGEIQPLKGASGEKNRILREALREKYGEKPYGI